jgi:hypothetical protein
MPKLFLLFPIIYLCLGVQFSQAQTPTNPVVVGSTSQTICSGKSTFFTANCAVGTPNWYEANETTLLKTNDVFLTPDLTANKSYKVRCEQGSARSGFVSVSVHINVNTIISANIDVNRGCYGTSAQAITLTANPNLTGTTPQYYWSKNNIPQGIPSFTNYTEPRLGLGGYIVYHTYVSPSSVAYVIARNASTLESAGFYLNISSGGSFNKKLIPNELDYVEVDKNGKIYLVGNLFRGIYSSTDGGNTFVRSNTDLTSMGGINCIKVAPNGYIYAGTSGEGIFISKDDGNTFTSKTIPDGLGSNVIVDIFIGKDGKIYIAHILGIVQNQTGGISISDDGGKTFVNKYKNISPNTNRIFVDDEGVIYVATTSGLSISKDGGNTFTTKTTANGLSTNNIRDVKVSQEGKIYAVTSPSTPDDKNLFISTDGGDSFVAYGETDGLGSNIVSSVSVDKNGRIYVGTTNGLSIANQSNTSNIFNIGYSQLGDVYEVRVLPSSEIGCTSPAYASKRVTIGNIPAVKAEDAHQNVCLGSSVSITAHCNNGTVKWYDSKTATTPVGTGSPLSVSPTTDKIYYPTCSQFGCESTRTEGITNFDGTLLANAPKFFRPKSFTATIEDLKNNVQPVEYKTHTTTILKAGKYIFSLDTEEGGSIDKAFASPFLCIYNANGFDPNFPLRNLVALSNEAGNTKTLTVENLISGTYTIVLSRYAAPTFLDLASLPWVYRIVQRNFDQSPNVKVFVQPIPTIAEATDLAVCSGSSASLTATCSNKNTPVWYNNIDIFYSNPLFSGSPLVIPFITANKTYQVRCESAFCASASKSVSVTISNVSNIPTLAANQQICYGSSTNLSSTCGSSTEVAWYSADGSTRLFTGNTFTTPGLTATTTYQYACENSLGCRGNTRQVVVSLKTPPTGLQTTYNIYQKQTIELSGVCGTGEQIVWYDEEDNVITKLSAGNPFYYKILVNTKLKAACEDPNSCISSQFVVTITATDPTPPAPIIPQNSFVITWGNSVTLLANGCVGSLGTYITRWYNALDDSEVLLPLTPLIASNYYARCELVINEKTYLSEKSTLVAVSFPNIITSVVSGNWEDSRTWNLGRIPTINDTVVIDNNHSVTINSMGEMKHLILKDKGKLKYNTANIRLRNGG